MIKKRFILLVFIFLMEILNASIVNNVEKRDIIAFENITNQLNSTLSNSLWVYQYKLIKDTMINSVKNFDIEKIVLYDKDLQNYYIVEKIDDKIIFKETNNYVAAKTKLYLIEQKLYYNKKNIGILYVYKNKTNDLTQEEKEYLKDNSFTYAGDPNWLPFEAFNNDGEYTGIVSEHIEILEKNLKIKFKKIITKDWTETLNLSKKVEVDIVSGDAADVVLAKNYKAIDTYMQNPLVMVAKDDHNFISDLNYLKDKKITFVDGYGFSADIYKKYPDIKFQICKSSQDGLLGVISGKYDIFIGTLAMVDYTIIQMGIEGIKITGDTGITMNLTLFVNKNKPLLYSILNKTMKSIPDIEKHKILYKWRHDKANKTIVDYTLLWQILFVVSILGTFLLYRQKLLQNKNLELGVLVDEKTKDLNNLNKNLEEKVEEKTKELKKQKDRYKFAIDGSSDGLWDWSIVTNEVYFSSRWKEIIGYKDDELENIFDTWQNNVHPDDLEGILKLIESNITGEKNTFTIEHRLKHKNGDWIWVLDRAKTIYDDNGKAIRISGFHTDISQQKQQTEQLIKSEKMASMGEMIGNIAHQWRQPLSVISTGATGMKMQKEYGVLTDEMFNETCTSINDNAQYLSKTIDDFRDFIKGDRTQKIFNLKDSINGFLHMVEGSIKNHDIHILLELQDDIEIDGFKNELTQCLINIFNNAKDVLEAKIEKTNNRFIFIETTVENNNAIIKIKDNAGGISEDIIGKVFEPYFTTKHQAQGTGLGLHMTYNLIVDGMNGNIEANNVSYKYDDEDYAGAEFIITLPMNQTIEIK